MGSRKVGGRQSKTHRLYKKHGNVKTAIEDFQSVEPMIVTNTNAQRKMHSFAYRKNGRVSSYSNKSTEGIINNDFNKPNGREI